MTIEELRKNLPRLTEQELQFCMFLMNKDKKEKENRSGIEQNFIEDELNEDYNEMSDYYEANPQW